MAPANLTVFDCKYDLNYVLIQIHKGERNGYREKIMAISKINFVSKLTISVQNFDYFL